MQPARLAALQPTRMSFQRSLMNRMIRERWLMETVRFAIDARARGEAVYRVVTPDGELTLVMFSFEPKREGRTGRIIGRSWDMMGALIDGPVDEDRIDQTRRELPKLYAGRAAVGTLVWFRSNRSLRAFDHVVERLAAGQQPDIAALARVGYLMRNTGLDGNGTFGTRTFLAYEPDHPLRHPYHPQMLSAYAMREFSIDLCEHLAGSISAAAVPIEIELRRFLGLGNGSGLGLGLWVNNHPRLLGSWLGLQEQALAAATALTLDQDSPHWERLDALIGRAIAYRRDDRMEYQLLASSQQVKDELELLRSELARHRGAVKDGRSGAGVLAELRAYAERRTSLEAAETLNALLIELIPDDADALLDAQVTSEVLVRRPQMTVGELYQIVRDEYAWALKIDLNTPSARNQIWYKSRDAEEPRRGPVDETPEGTVPLHIDVPGDVQRLERELRQCNSEQSVARFLLAHPELRFAVERIQGLAGTRYHSPHMNMLSDDFHPIALIRLINVAMYGIDKTRDYMGRNLRGLMFHGAPTREEIAAGADPDWFWPGEPVAAECECAPVGVLG